jgi:hypothetical protein
MHTCIILIISKLFINLIVTEEQTYNKIKVISKNAKEKSKRFILFFENNRNRIEESGRRKEKTKKENVEKGQIRWTIQWFYQNMLWTDDEINAKKSEIAMELCVN